MKNLFYWLLALLFPYLIIYLALGDTIYLFLKAGYIGLPYCFPYIFKTGMLQGILFLISFLGLIVVLFAKGLNLRKKILGKVFVSTSLFLWFLLGFICLGIHM
jgi:glycerol uptake facilitator